MVFAIFLWTIIQTIYISQQETKWRNAAYGNSGSRWANCTCLAWGNVFFLCQTRRPHNTTQNVSVSWGPSESLPRQTFYNSVLISKINSVFSPKKDDWAQSNYSPLSLKNTFGRFGSRQRRWKSYGTWKGWAVAQQVAQQWLSIQQTSWIRKRSVNYFKKG